MNDELKALQEQREAVQRKLLDAPPGEQREALQSSLVTLRDRETDLMQSTGGEVNSFGGAAPQPEQVVTEPAPATARDRDDTLREMEPRVTVHSNRLGGFLSDRVTVTHDSPVIAEARQATARTAAINAMVEKLQAEKPQKQAQEQARDKADQERAARIYYGMPSQGRGIEATLQGEQRSAALDADFAGRQGQGGQAKTEPGHEQAASEHDGAPRELMEGESIEGEIVDEMELDGQGYYVVEGEPVQDVHDTQQGHNTQQEHAAQQAHKIERVLVPSGGGEYQIGDEVIAVRKPAGHQVEEAGRGYAR